MPPLVRYAPGLATNYKLTDAPADLRVTAVALPVGIAS
jgi:hypothetical protein